MKFEFGEVLTRAWNITWKHKVLWLIGILFGLLVSFMFPLLFSPALLPMLMQNSSFDVGSVSLFIIAIAILILLFLVVLYPVSVFVQSSLTLGVLNANDEDSEPLSAMDLIKKSVPFFWRVLGLMVLFAVGMGLFNLIIQAVVLLSTILTLGIATICMMPLMLLMYPVLYGATVWLEQAMNAIIVDNMTVMQAARQGWKLLRNHPGTMALMALVIYLGVGIVTGILMLPIMLPFFILPFGFLENQANWGILLIAAASILVFIPLFSVITGMSMIFTKSAWVLTYLRLTRGLSVQPLPQLVEAAA